MDNNYFPCGIKLNAVIPAIVTCIKKDKVKFSVKSQTGQEREAYYYLHGQHLNLHKIFKQGQTVDVRVISINKDSHHNLIEVRPKILPVDTFLEQTPLESTVSGKVIDIRDSCVFVEIAKNVIGRAKKFKNARVGMNVKCFLQTYNPNTKMVQLRILR